MDEARGTKREERCVRLMEDRDLLERYRRGDRQALEVVFRHYAPAVARWIRHGFSYENSTGRQRFAGIAAPADQHEILQEVFRRSFEASARTAYSGLRPFESYLFVLTRNLILRRLERDRHESRRREEAAESMRSEIASVEDSLAAKQVRALVRTFLDGLSPKDREFLSVRFMEGQSQQAAAEVLGWTRKKVRVEEERLRTALVRFLKRSRGSREISEVIHVGAAL